MIVSKSGTNAPARPTCCQIVTWAGLGAFTGVWPALVAAWGLDLCV